MIGKIYRAIRNALRGLRHAYFHEASFRMEVWAGLFLVLFGYIVRPLTETELLFLVFSYLFILAMELVNTSLERMFARLHPEHHELVGISKDLSSAAVLVATVFAGVVVLVILLNRLVG